MADNMGNFWSVNDLMKRYNINRASLIEYAKAKENIINANAVNMQKTGKEWQFNSEAVRILDELRGYGVVVENYDSPEKARIAELEAELEEARKFMAVAQAENSRQKDRIIELLEEKTLLLEEKNEAKVLLTMAESERKNTEFVICKQREEIEAVQHEQRKASVEIEALREENANAKVEAEAIKKKLYETRVAFSAEKNKSWWQKLLGR